MANNVSIDNQQNVCEFNIKSLPKIELHAHLHGSIRRSTLKELIHKNDIQFDLNQNINLSSGFQLFSIIHQVINTLELVERVTREVIEDFMSDGVIYLELRTTPRQLNANTSKLEYLTRVLRVIEEKNLEFYHKMITRLIVSIDRGRTVEDAEDTVSIVQMLMHSKQANLIVGFDFSGNPNKGLFKFFIPILSYIRSIGLNITIHAAEIVDVEVEDRKTEMTQIIDFSPNRLGHALHLRKTHIQMLSERQIPIEITPTSNLFTLQLDAHHKHPTLGMWLSASYPIAICTDDTGIFDVNLSSEFATIMSHFNVTKARMIEMGRRAIEFIFADELIKIRVNAIFQDALSYYEQEQLCSL